MSTSAEGSLDLDLAQVGDLFQAPALNPFSTRELEVLGQNGVEYVIKRARQHWPRRSRVQRLTLRLPAEQIAPDSQRRVEAALQRYCAEQIAENRRQLRLALDMTGREFLLAITVTIAAIVWVTFVINGPLQSLPSPLLGAVVLVPLLSSSIAIWDALEGLVFGWLPYVIDNQQPTGQSARWRLSSKG